MKSTIVHLPMRLPARRVLACLAALAAFVTPCSAQFEWINGTEADRLVIGGGNTAFWKATCTSSPSGRTKLFSAGLARTDVRIILNNPCSTLNEARGGIAADNSASVFWLSGGGQVKRNSSTVRTAPDPTRITPYSDIGVSPGYTFFSDETNLGGGEFFENGRLWRAARDGSGSAEIVFDYSTGTTIASVRSLHVAGDTRVIAHLTNDNLVNFTLTTTPPPFPTSIWLPSTIASNVTASCLAAGRLCWARQSGTTVTFFSAPLTNTSTQTNLGTATLASGQTVNGLAAGNGQLFYQTATAAAGELWRRSATAASTAAVVATLDHRVVSLCATDEWVCWIDNGTVIQRMPVGQAAVTRNLAVSAASDAPAGSPPLEIVQAVQNHMNLNPLVADKITHVRAWARIAASSTGETALTPSPLIVLHGSRGGVPLPGSPLAPLRVPAPPPLGTSAGARTTGADGSGTVASSGYWFRLPPSWCVQGTTSLRSEVNPGRSLTETNYADNLSAAVSAAFTQKVPIGMKFVPTVTHFGRIDRFEPSFQELFDQLEALLPTSDLRWEFCTSDNLDEDHVFSHSPFEFRPGDDDYHKVLWALGWKKIFGCGGRLAEPGGYDHYVSMLPAASNEGVGYSGVAWPGDEVSITVSQSLFFVNPTRSALGVRLDATTQAQEIAHNYGLRHVDCGGPSDVNIIHPYPYANNELSSAAAGYQGFNPLNGRLIGRQAAVDYMTYCPSKWTSDHAWRRMFARVNSGFGPRSSRSAGGAACVLGGIIDLHTRTATVKHAFQMSAAETVRANASMPRIDSRYELRAFQGATFRRGFPVRTGDPLADQGQEEGEFTGWTSLPGDLSDVNRLELVDLQLPSPALGSITGGGAAPAVSVTLPASGAVITAPQFEIKWTSSDDGAQPLSHMIRYSHDNGTTWRLLASDWGTPRSYIVNTAEVPGGTKCRAQVIASDGILSTAAMSAEFSIPNKPPAVTMFVENSRGKICAPLAMATVDCGEALTLHAEVSDMEDGWLADSAVAWTVAGPVTRTGTGRIFQPAGLLPGTYTVTCLVTDESAATTTATLQLVVRPCYVENAATAPVIDGFLTEAAWNSDRVALPLMFAGGYMGEVRMVHNGTRLYIAATGLLTGTNASHRFSIAFDTDRTGAGPDPGDFMVEVYEDGAAVVSGANVIDWVTEPDSSDITSAVGGDATHWSIELCIPDTRFTAWDGRTIRCRAGSVERNTSSDHTFWPPSASFSATATWADMVLGPDPDDPTDADRDGMADQWEIARFGNTSRGVSSDFDGDGQADASEYTAGTDPRSHTSRFRAAPAIGGPRGSIAWNSVPGRSYTVSRSTDLLSWNAVALGLPHSTGGTGTWTDPAPPPGKAFYRVEAHYCR